MGSGVDCVVGMPTGGSKGQGWSSNVLQRTAGCGITFAYNRFGLGR